MVQASNLFMPLKLVVSFAIASCLAVLSYLYLFDINPTLSKTYITNLRITQAQENRNEHHWQYNPETKNPIICDRNHFYYDICYLNRPTIVNPKTATFFTSSNSTQEITETIHPHPRILNTPVYLVREITLTTRKPNVSCTVIHHKPALIISTGGWTGNFWHDITDRFIPLFMTMEAFFPDHEFVLGIFDYNNWWVQRYTHLLKAYNNHQIINLDKETYIHCFPSVTVGLISHGPTQIDPTLQRAPNPKTIHDFSAFLKNVYSQNETVPLPWKSDGRPRLVIVNRNGTRSILNIDQVRKEAEEIGFEVSIFMLSQRTTLHEAFSLVSSSHAFIGVHGEALTNILFLRPGTVFIQIVPSNCSWLADLCFGKMATQLGLEYMNYDVEDNESILELDQKTRDWVAQKVIQIEIWAVYREQILKLDTMRFKRYLKRAYKKSEILMRKQQLKALVRVKPLAVGG